MEEQLFKEVLEELQKDMLNTELIQDNKLHFNFEDNIYRVRMPNQKENAEANNYKNKIFVKLLQEKNEDGSSSHLMEKPLIQLLKESAQVDIEGFTKKAKKIEDEMTQLYLTLSKKKDSEKKAIKKLKQELEVLRNKRLNIILEKAGYLTPAIENQTQDDYYRFLTCICIEKLVNEKKDKWSKVWKNFSEYEADNSKLPYIALGRFTELMYGA